MTGVQTCALPILLDALRSQATFMMMFRDSIKMELRETAYVYV